MSWLGGYKPSTSKQVSESELREAKRKKLEEERQQRLQRAQERVNRQKQLQAAVEAQAEADKAFKELCALVPDILEGDFDDSNVDEDILNDSEEATMAAEFDVEDGKDGDKAMDKLGSVKCEFSKEDIEFWFSELEGQLEVIEVKSQWTKRTALQRFLPMEIKTEVKSLFLSNLPQGISGYAHAT